MTHLRALFFVLSFAAAASAADFTIKVVDPQSLPVAAAQVQLLRAGSSQVLATRTTSGDGVAIFHTDLNQQIEIRVLAPGFAQEIVSSPRSTELLVQLRLAPASETVVVSATRTPVVGDAAGADVDTLSGGQLETTQPVAGNDAMRFLPGAVVNTAGQRGGLSSLFVRGGESNYNKVIVDGVTVNEPGGTFDFGNMSLAQGDRLEFVRGAQSTIYGSDAMTSVVQMWTRTGNTRTPELRFGADGGNLSTAHGYASLAGADGKFDYNVFGDQLTTQGSGINDAYSNALEGANLGVALSDSVSLRAHFRHFNTHTGVPGEWNFNGYDPLVPVNGFASPYEPLSPNPIAWSQLNNLLGGVELAVSAPSGWQHHFTAFDYLYRYHEFDPGDPQRVNTENCAFSGPPVPCSIDFVSDEVDRINRAGFEYQGDYSERTWAHTTFGYRVENENGYVGDINFGQTHGQRLNNDLYAQQQLILGRLGVIAGGRFVHDSAFGSTGVPRIALTFQVAHGSWIFSGTRLRFSYSTGFKEPRLEETFNGVPPSPYNLPNPGLKPERVRAFEGGFQQGFLNDKYEFSATYFNNLFHDQINYVSENLPPNNPGMYVNVNQAFAQGAELVLRAKLQATLSLNAAYTYTSSQYLDDPAPFPPIITGNPLLRRPKHSATGSLSYLGLRWGANLAGSFVGRRSDSDFDGFGIEHAAGYVRADLGGWYAIRPRVTAYVNVENAFDRHYNEVVGYPALPLNFRAGLRFRIGGE